MRHESSCRQKKIISVCFALGILSVLLVSCATSGKPPYDAEKYLLSYPAPVWTQAEKMTTSVKFNRFSIAAAYNSTEMIFRSDAYSIDAFNYSRWAVNPADMIADGLLADMRGSGLFQSVLSRYEADQGRFVISGGVEEFYLLADKKSKAARISLSILMQDSAEKETGKKMMFQKRYFREEPLQEPSPRGYCQAASKAMQTISREVIGDIYAAVKARIQ